MAVRRKAVRGRDDLCAGADKISKAGLKLGLLFQPWILAGERPSLLPPQSRRTLKTINSS